MRIAAGASGAGGPEDGAIDIRGVALKYAGEPLAGRGGRDGQGPRAPSKKAIPKADMILFAFAVPGRFGEWCEAVIARLFEAALGPMVAIDANGAEAMAGDLIRAGAAPVFVKGMQPEPWLCRALIATGRPLVIALEDPRDAAFHLMHRRGVQMVDALRRVAGSCASMMPCVGLPSALVLNAARDWLDPLATAEKIANHFDLALSRDDIVGIVAELDAAGFGPEHAPPAWPVDAEAEVAAAIIDGIAAPYIDHFLGAPFGSITWTGDLMMADGHKPAIHAIDVTGRSRPLLFGPNIIVPAGHWNAEVALSFFQGATDVNFLIEIMLGETQVSKTSIQPAAEGTYSVNLAFVVAEGDVHSLEFRVVNEKPAFDGSIALERITLTLLPEPTADAPREDVGTSE